MVEEALQTNVTDKTVDRPTIPRDNVTQTTDKHIQGENRACSAIAAEK